MAPTPQEQLARACAELSGALRGRTATFEALLPGGEPALIAAGACFDGLRLDDHAARLLVFGGGTVLWAGDGPARLAQEGDMLLVEVAGGPAVRIAFAPEGRTRPRPALRERSVGEAGA